MNRSSSGSSGLVLSKALVGFLNSKAAEGLCDGTLTNYEFRLKQWIDFTGDPAVDAVTPQDIREFLVWLRTEYRPRRYDGDRRPLSPKTIRNAYCQHRLLMSTSHRFEMSAFHRISYPLRCSISSL